MKAIKSLGLVVLAALTAMALVGVSSALAENTALCSVDENPCAGGNQVSHVHESTLTGNLATMLTSVGNVTCDVLFLGDAEITLANPLVLKGKYTYTNCKRGKESCTVPEVSAAILVLKVGAETANGTLFEELQVKCGLFIDCTYIWEQTIYTVKGPLTSSETNGSTLASEAAPNRAIGICPGTSKLDITTTPLSATYISS